jgi:hypothetical protein
MLTAAFFAAIVAGSEALKVVAGFGQRPTDSQLWSLAMVTALSVLLGWLDPPRIDLSSKKNPYGLSI